MALILWAAGFGAVNCAVYGKVPDDEAKAHHPTAQDFRHEITEKENYFKGMDAIAEPASTPDQLLSPGRTPPPRKLGDPVATTNEILGRDTWMLWCARNEGFWDWLAGNGYGFTDLLKLFDTRTRPTRVRTAGLINEPGMKQSTTPDENGVWLDVPVEDERHEPAAPKRSMADRAALSDCDSFPILNFRNQRPSGTPCAITRIRTITTTRS